jgi:hypothetical protein
LRVGIVGAARGDGAEVGDGFVVAVVVEEEPSDEVVVAVLEGLALVADIVARQRLERDRVERDLAGAFAQAIEGSLEDGAGAAPPPAAIMTSTTSLGTPASSSFFISTGVRLKAEPVLWIVCTITWAGSPDLCI